MNVRKIANYSWKIWKTYNGMLEMFVEELNDDFAHNLWKTWKTNYALSVEKELKDRYVCVLVLLGAVLRFVVVFVGEDLWMVVFAACAFSEMSVFTN